MTKNIYIYLMAMLMVLFVACKPDTQKASVEQAPTKVETAESLYGTWRLNLIDTLYNTSREDWNKMTAKYVRNGLLLNFFPDNILTRIDGQKYSSTTWNFNGLKSSLAIGKLKDGLGDSFDFGFDKLMVYNKFNKENLIVENETGIYHFKKVSEPLVNAKDDPYHPDNNQWRVVAPKSETYIQMKERIMNYTQHNYYLFKATKERGGEKVVNSNSIGIFVYYDGAIGLVNGGKVPSAWMANFYSPDEAMDGYAFMNEYFKAGFIRKKNPDGFVAAGEVIFKQLVDKMGEALRPSIK